MNIRATIAHTAAVQPSNPHQGLRVNSGVQRGGAVRVFHYNHTCLTHARTAVYTGDENLDVHESLSKGFDARSWALEWRYLCKLFRCAGGVIELSVQLTPVANPSGPLWSSGGPQLPSLSSERT